MSKEAMTLALEALDNAQHFIDEYAAAKYIHAHNAAITSLRQAIAEAELPTQEELIAIYATPQPAPQGEARGLSQQKPLKDEQIESMWQEYCKQWKTGEKIVIQFVDFARAIEKYYGIKGEE